MADNPSQAAARQFLIGELRSLDDSIPAGLASREGITYKKVTSHDVILPQRWRGFTESSHADDAQTGDIVPNLASEITGSPLLLLGEAGIGKSLTMQRLFARLARSFLETDEDAPLPVLVRLDTVQLANQVGPSVNGLTLIEAISASSSSFSERLDLFAAFYRAQQLILLLDGLDELPGPQDPQSIRARSRLLLVYPQTIVSSRMDYFQRFFAGGNLDAYFRKKVALESLPFDESSRKYVQDFCKLIGSDQAPAINRVLAEQEDLRELCENPLRFNMAVDVLDARLASGTNDSYETWTQTKLYREYTLKWLRNEASKPDSRLTYDQKDLLVRLIARTVFFSGGGTIEQSPAATQELVISQQQVYKALTHRWHGEISGQEMMPAVSLNDLADEVCRRTFLIATTSLDDGYRFIHKSFLDFYLALDIWSILRDATGTLAIVTQYFERPLLDLLIRFLRGSLRASKQRPNEASVVSSNLLRIFSMAKREDDPVSVTIRQHAGNLLALVATESAMKSLVAELEQEPHQFVRRGIIEGLGMHWGRLDLIEKYVRQLRDDTCALALQLGYTRIYRGDQQFDDSWEDDRTEFVDKTMHALVRSLRYTKYPALLPMNLHLIRALVIDGRGRIWFEANPRLAEECLENLELERPELGEVYGEERELLRKLLFDRA